LTLKGLSYVVDALLTLSSKGQLVIPARLRQRLGLCAGNRLEPLRGAPPWPTQGLSLHTAHFL
jgi:hypothetical protein